MCYRWREKRSIDCFRQTCQQSQCGRCALRRSLQLEVLRPTHSRLTQPVAWKLSTKLPGRAASFHSVHSRRVLKHAHQFPFSLPDQPQLATTGMVRRFSCWVMSKAVTGRGVFRRSSVRIAWAPSGLNLYHVNLLCTPSATTATLSPSKRTSPP